MAADLSKPFFVSLGLRGRVRIAGPDARAFLQAIISNDVAGLDGAPAVYSCLLTPQGKFLHDFFVTQENGTLLLDCEPGPRAEDLLKKIRPYKLRSKVELTVEPDVESFAVIGSGQGGGYTDPRDAALGYRTVIRPEGLEEKPRAAWDDIRIRLGIPDGSRDMEVGKDTLLECNIDKAQGLSHTKGCYVGQEITARMHLRGLVKHHLRPVTLRMAPPPFADIVIAGQRAGQMRAGNGGIGLAMLKDELLPLLQNPESPIALLETLS